MEYCNYESLKKEGLIRRALYIGLIILVVEIAFGIISNSLALLTDALHVFMDVSSNILALLAVRISRREADERYSMGYHRFEIMAAFLNGLLLVVAVLLIFREAYERFLNPKEVLVAYMLPAAIFGLIGNLYVVGHLHAHRKDLNIKGVYLHALSDSLSSFAVVFGGVLIAFTGKFILDCVMSVFIGVIILYSAVKLIKESAHLLLQGVPPDINIKDVRDFIESFPEVQDVHDLHIYALCSNMKVLGAHVVVDDLKLSEVEKIRRKIEKGLEEKFGITITNIQFEHRKCKNFN
jgi:cobalt-zinc-cadmium efflux system protein